LARLFARWGGKIYSAPPDLLDFLGKMFASLKSKPLPPRMARCSTLHGIRLKSDTVHRYVFGAGIFTPRVESSNAKSWGPLWGSDLVIDDTADKKTCPGWMVSRSEAIHLISDFLPHSFGDRGCGKAWGKSLAPVLFGGCSFVFVF